MSERCIATDDAGYWWGNGLIDPSEPGFVRGRGVFIPESKPCQFVPEAGKDLCYKHRFLIETTLDARKADAAAALENHRSNPTHL